MTRITILLLLVVAFSAVPVAADDELQVLWDQCYDFAFMNGGWGIYGEYYTQDDFTLETDADIEVVEFWAFYSPEEPAHPRPFDVNVRYDQYGMPGAYYFWNTLSLVHEKMKNTSEAIKAKEKAIELAPDTAKENLKKDLEKLKAAAPGKK